MRSHTQACMYSLDRDYDPVSVSICFSPLIEQHLLVQRKPLDNTTDKNRCCCYYETDNLFVRIHRMFICLHQCSCLCRRGQITGNYMPDWAPAGYIERDLSMPLSNGTAQIITNRFPLSAVGWTNTFQPQNTIFTNPLLVDCVTTPFILKNQLSKHSKHTCSLSVLSFKKCLCL